MRFFRYGFVSVAFWATKSVVRIGSRQIAKKRFFGAVINSPEIKNIDEHTEKIALESVWNVANQVTSSSKKGEANMKNILINSPNVPMMTASTGSSVYRNLYSIGRDSFFKNKGKPIWRSFFIKAVVASHLIPCIGEDTAVDILNIICDIVEHTVTPEVAAKTLFGKLLASHVDIPMIGHHTELVVFESLYNIAHSMIIG